MITFKFIGYNSILGKINQSIPPLNKIFPGYIHNSYTIFLISFVIAISSMWWLTLAILLPLSANARSFNTSMVFVDNGDVLVTNDKWIIILDLKLDDCQFAFEKIVEFEKSLLFSINDFRKQNEAREPSLVKEFVKDMLKDWATELDLIEQEFWKIRTEFDALVYALIPKKTRQKRALADIGGQVLKVLFGTLDNSDLVNINRKLSQLEASSEFVQHMIKEQLSYVPKIELVMKNQQEFAKTMIEITRSIKKISDELWYNDVIRLYQHKFNTGIRVFSNSVNRIKQTSKILVNALLTTNNGKIDPNLIKPGHFLKVLKNVQSNMPAEFLFITPVLLENLHVFYDIGKSSAYLVDHTIRLFIEIPLKAQEREFTIYKALPIPIPIVQNNMRMKMKTEASYLALSKNKNLHFEMNLIDFSACRGQFIKICPFNAPIYRRHNVNTCLYANYIGDHEKIKELCEIIISKRNNAEWIKIDNGETWVYDLEQEDLNLVCTNEESKHISVQGTGSLNIPKSCEVHGKDYLLIQNIVGESNLHPFTLGILDNEMLSFLESLANFTLTSMITIDQNVALNDIITKPGWDIDFSKGVEVKVLKMYMEKLQNEKEMNVVNYRIIALYVILIVSILAYFSYLIYGYLQTVEFIFRKAVRRNPVPNPRKNILRSPSLESLEIINLNPAVEA